MLNFVKIFNNLLFLNLSLGAIISHQSPNSFQTFLNAIKSPFINFQELYDEDTLYDADMLLNTFSTVHLQNANYEDNDPEETCKWMENTKCSENFEPICVTDLNCIYVVRNKCILDKLNCKCTSHYILPSTFCENFSQPLFKRCNIKIFIK
ncbi:uncharacterized protein ACRADG_002310 isoform 4-T4 [Cochliomyia hominivorax]